MDNVEMAVDKLLNLFMSEGMDDGETRDTYRREIKAIISLIIQEAVVAAEKKRKSGFSAYEGK